jgi:hypothetical protein
MPLAVGAIVRRKQIPMSRILMLPNVRDQRWRAVGAPLADRILSEPHALCASGVTTRDDRCIA